VSNVDVICAGVLEMAASESGVGFSGHTLDKATKAKVTLENYYSNLIAQHIERKKRFVLFLLSQELAHSVKSYHEILRK